MDNSFRKFYRLFPVKVILYLCISMMDVRKYDASRLVTQPGVFRKLQDMDTFRSCMTVLNGTVAWDLEGNRDETRCIDIDPFTVYDSPVVKDPLESMQTA